MASTSPSNGHGGLAPPPARDDQPDLRRLAQPSNIYTNRAADLGGIKPATVSAILRELRDGWLERWVDLSGHMTRFDGHLRSIYYTRRAAIAGAPFTISPSPNVPDQDRAIAAQAAEFLARMLAGQRDAERLFLQLLDAIGRGVSVAELIYARDSGAWIARPEWIHTRRFRFAPDYSVRLWDQGTSSGVTDGLRLAPGKFIVHAPCLIAEHVPDSGELLSCVWWWLLKTWGRRFYSVACDRFGSPRAIGHLPQNATATSRQALLDALDALANDASGILEDGTTIEVQDPKASQSGEMWVQFIRGLDDEMSKAILGATDLSAPGENGARAAVETRNGVRLERAQADAKVFAGTIERDWFGPVLNFNAHLFGGRVPPIPRIEFELADAPSPQTAIYQYHMQNRIVTRNEVRQQLGLEPLPAERGGDELLDMIPGGQQPGAPDAAGGADAAVPFPQSQRRPSPKRQPNRAQLKLGISTPTPSPIRSGSPSPIARALRGQSGDRSR